MRNPIETSSIKVFAMLPLDLLDVSPKRFLTDAEKFRYLTPNS